MAPEELPLTRAYSTITRSLHLRAVVKWCACVLLIPGPSGMGRYDVRAGLVGDWMTTSERQRKFLVPQGITLIGIPMIVQNRIAGTRITIWDVLHYLEAGWSRPEIAATLHLTEAQVAAAARYIEAHRDEVMVVHRHIEDRKARGNPPDLLVKAAKSRAKLQAWLKHHHETNT